MGNFNTKVAYKLPDSEENGFVMVPSYVNLLGPNQTPEIGAKAKNSANRYSKSTVTKLKNLIG